MINVKYVLRFLLLASVFYSFDILAYQTELGIEGISARYRGTNDAQDGGALLHVDYAFSDHETAGAPLAESRFYHPQSHIYFSAGDTPLFETSYITGWFNNVSVDTVDVGANYYFYESSLFAGGNYRSFDTFHSESIAEYTLQAGGYPMKGLRVMLAMNRYDNSGYHINSGSIGARYLLNFSSQNALMNELIYTTSDKRFDGYTVAYKGAFYFNRLTALHYGYQSLKGRNIGGHQAAYELGVERFLNDSTSVKFLYSDQQDQFDLATSNMQIRVIDVTLSVKF